MLTKHHHSCEISKINQSYRQKIEEYDNWLKRIVNYSPDIKELLPIVDQY